MIFYLAIGDSYGAAFEFVKDPYSKGLLNNGYQYQQNPRYPTLKPSWYTDDTMRALSVIDVMANGDPLNGSDYIAAMQRRYALDQRDGWSRKFQQYLEDNHEKSPAEFAGGLKRADSNGSLMGAAPLSYLGDVELIKLAAGIQAMTTHSYRTVPYAQAIALSAYWMRNSRDHSRMDTLVQFLETEINIKFDPKPIPPNSMSAEDTVNAVLHVLIEGKGYSLTDLLKRAIVMGGDTDSVAAQVMAIAFRGPYEDDIPASMFEELEDGDPLKLQELKVANYHLGQASISYGRVTAEH